MKPNDLSRAFTFLEEAAQQSDKIFFIFDVKPIHFIYMNPAFEQIWKISLEEIFSDPATLLEMIHPEDKKFLVRTYHEILDGKHKKAVEFRIRFHDESIRWLSLDAHLLKAISDKQVIAGFVQDITKNKHKETIMHKYVAKKDSIMEILSHDLAGPLNNISGLASLVLKKIKGPESAELEKLVKTIEETSERSIRLIREFIKQEFLQSENSELAKERKDIVRVIKEIIDQYKKSEKNISKTFYFDAPDKPVFMLFDMYKFSQVLNNLISNAIKFTRDKGEISVVLKDKKDTVLITVADNGVGIPQKYHESLFEKFTKARRPGLKGEPSVGLGMSIIKTIIEWHNGKIWFKSSEKEGTTFYIELPRE